MATTVPSYCYSPSSSSSPSPSSCFPQYSNNCKYESLKVKPSFNSPSLSFSITRKLRRKPFVVRSVAAPTNATAGFDEMVAGTQRKYFMLGGKGGVGKTSCAASLAVKFANSGHPTLVVSTDPAHSLSDSFAQDLAGGALVQVEGPYSPLFSLELNPEKAKEEFRSAAQKSVNPCISAYLPIAPSRSAAQAINPGFPASLGLNKSSSTYTVAGLRKFSLKVVASKSRYQKSSPVCLFGGKKSGSGDQAAPKEALENFLGSFKKEQSIEDVLRQQIKKQEFFDDGGTGGGGGGSGGSGGSEDENTSDESDELFQVTMATLGFIYTYIYILQGEDIGRYIRDVIRYYIFRGRKSIRLRKLIAKCNSKWKIIKGKYMMRLTDEETDEVDGLLLGHVIQNTQTWYYSPTKKAPKKVEKRAKFDPVYGEEYYEDDDDDEDYYYY